jgi:radical SAM superfamily enzyme YgiQ (UPF0313 family)
MNILMLYPEFPDTFWSFKYAVNFVNKNAVNPPLGLVTVAALLPKEWNKRLIDLNVHPLTAKDLSWADLVMVSAMDVQRSSVKKVIAACKEAGKKVCAGGPLFTEDYQNFQNIDYFVLNEGEITVPMFVRDWEAGCPKPVYTTTEYADITQTPMPMWDLLNLNDYDSMAVQFSRGCPFNCEFCNVTALLGHRPRTKTAKQLIAELDKLYENGWRRNIFLVDDNFIGNKRILKEEVLPALIEWRKGKTGCLFITEASINMADDPQLMDLMARAGFLSIFVGVETPDEDSLTECHKSQNRNRDLIENIKTLQRHGFQIMGGFIVGFDSDTPAIFERQIRFIQESGIITAMVGLLQAPFGTGLYRRMMEEGRINTTFNGDNTDGTSNIIPIMDPEVLFQGYQHLLEQIYSPRLFYQRIRTFLNEFRPNKATVTLEWREIVAFLRSIWRLGILGEERWEYWKLFFWTLFKHPGQFPLAITFSIYGYHFRKVSKLHVLKDQPKPIAQPQVRPLTPQRALSGGGK